MRIDDSLRGNKVDFISTKDNNMRGRRIINASPSQNAYDYVVRKELDEVMNAIKTLEAERTPVDIHKVVPSLQSDVFASRGLGVVYHNATLFPMFVLVTMRCVSSGGATFGQADLKVGPTNPPTIILAGTFNGSGLASVNQHFAFWVLPGYYYQVVVVNASVTVMNWIEWA